MNMDPDAEKQGDSQEAKRPRVGDEVYLTGRVKSTGPRNPSASVADAISKGKEVEIAKYLTTGTVSVVDDEGQKKLPTRWVIPDRIKEGEAVKARLTIRGDLDRRPLEVDSPTAAKQTARVVVALSPYINRAHKYSCSLRKLDVERAFLQSSQDKFKELAGSEGLYVLPPVEWRRANPGKCWALERAAYGLREAPRMFFETLMEVLVGKIDLIPCCTDASVFVAYCNEEQRAAAKELHARGAYRVQQDDGERDSGEARYRVLREQAGVIDGYCIAHVDDLLLFGTPDFHRTVTSAISEWLKCKEVEVNRFTYCGVQYYFDPRENILALDQREYVQGISPIPVRRGESSDRVVTDEELRSFRSLCGALLWAASQTRPDILCDVSFLAIGMADQESVTVSDLRKANKVLRKCQGVVGAVLVFSAPGDCPELFLFSDSSFNSRPRGGSQRGTIVVVGHRDGPVVQGAPAYFESKKVQRVCRSTYAAELLAMSASVDALLFVKATAQQCGFNPKSTAFTDAANVERHINALVLKAPDEKSLLPDVVFLRTCFQQSEARLEWVPTKCMIADALTKEMHSEALLVSMQGGSYGISKTYVTLTPAVYPEEVACYVMGEKK